MNILVTGGAGFIGSAVVRRLVARAEHRVCTLDKLTYSGSLANLASIRTAPNHRFEQLDICDRARVDQLFDDFKPNAIVHLAAESHVDRSIDEPGAFIQTNIVGTYTLLEAACSYQNRRGESLRFLHVSTDEVYGSLGATDLFREDSPYQPNSPYSASKAASDHLARAWGKTFDLDVLITNCSNNYGPYQFPEKLIPLIIQRALNNQPVPVYGDGQQVRDWLYVEDHAAALELVLSKGRCGETYNVGGNAERTNIAVVEAVLGSLAQARGLAADYYFGLIAYVEDRPGHDRRYAIDAEKISSELGWQAATTFESGIAQTVAWYLNNEPWIAAVSGQYSGERLGLGQKTL